MKSDLFINPEYKKRAQALRFDLKKFDRWIDALTSVNYISPDLSMELLKRFDIRFPRLIHPHNTKAFKLYRARIIPSDSNEDISNPKTFSYPPAEFATSYQRANIPGAPVFYGAMDGKTALEELRLNGNNPISEGDQVYVSEWRLKPNTRVNLASITIPSIRKKNQMFSILTEKAFNEFPEIFKNEDYFFYQECLYSYKWLSNLFLTGRHMLTGTIAHDVIYNTPITNGIKVDGLMYPSCSNDFRSINIALSPIFVDEHLELVSVRKHTFKKFSSKGALTSSRYWGFINGRQITWKVPYTELMVSEYDSKFEVEKPWSKKISKNAHFTIKGELINIDSYCSQIIDTIDLNQFEIPEKDLHHYLKGNTRIYNVKIEFEKGGAYLKTKEDSNQVKRLLIDIPVKTGLRTVNNAEVLSFTQ